MFNLVEDLSLKGNSLNGSIPSWVCEFDELLRLDLEYNYFEGAIPACIGESLLGLAYLALSGNLNLSGELPVSICDLVNLEELWVYKTSIEGILSI